MAYALGNALVDRSVIDFVKAFTVAGPYRLEPGVAVGDLCTPMSSLYEITRFTCTTINLVRKTINRNDTCESFENSPDAPRPGGGPGPQHVPIHTTTPRLREKRPRAPRPSSSKRPPSALEASRTRPCHKAPALYSP